MHKLTEEELHKMYLEDPEEFSVALFLSLDQVLSSHLRRIKELEYRLKFGLKAPNQS